jgi:hypothetical protein
MQRVNRVWGNTSPVCHVEHHLRHLPTSRLLQVMLNGRNH